MAVTAEQNAALEDLGESLDRATFDQILEMDDEDDDEKDRFSRSITIGFLHQAKNTLKQMHESIKEKDLENLSQLGHFLKGSSATLGLTKIRNSTEKIQHLGHKQDATGSHDQDEEKCLEEIKTEVGNLTKERDYVNAGLRKVYPPIAGEQVDSDEEE